VLLSVNNLQGASAHPGINVDIDPLSEQDRVRFVADHPRLYEHVSVPREPSRHGVSASNWRAIRSNSEHLDLDA
jgi:hypothetical protein